MGPYKTRIGTHRRTQAAVAVHKTAHTAGAVVRLL